LRLRLFKSQSIKVVFCDPCQPLVCRDCIAATETLRDHALGSGRNRRRLPAGNLDSLTIAGQCEFSVLVHISYFSAPNMPQPKENDEWRNEIERHAVHRFVTFSTRRAYNAFRS